MSLWYSCTFAAIGTDAEIQKLNAACDTYWHRAQASKGLSPGFIQVQARRNHGADEAIEKMGRRFSWAHFCWVALHRPKFWERLHREKQRCRQLPMVAFSRIAGARGMARDAGLGAIRTKAACCRINDTGA